MNRRIAANSSRTRARIEQSISMKELKISISACLDAERTGPCMLSLTLTGEQKIESVWQKGTDARSQVTTAVCCCNHGSAVY